MVSDKQAREDHKRSSKIPSLGSKRNHGVTKQASNSLKYMTKRMNAHDSLLVKSFIRGEVRDEVERKFQELLMSREYINEGGRSGAKSLELCFINNNKLPINTFTKRMNAHDSLLMKSFIRGEVERKFQELREKINEGGKSGARSLELVFINNNKLPVNTFTKTNLIPKDEPLQVALFDVRSKSIVNEGVLSSIKIQICPIQGKFESGDDEDWTESEFNGNILHERDNKEPLLIGDRFVTLQNGVASIFNIKFTDNSGLARNKEFSLGAKAMKNGDIIKEGRSQAFRVKDIRGEGYKKHYPPSLMDDVWRLEKISKNGPFRKRLHNNGIDTVKDLLRLLKINESSLHEKFENIQKKCWSDIIEHAGSCVVDDYMLYSYEIIIGQPILLLFNVIYELVGVTFDKQNFYVPDDLTLTPKQKNLVEIVKKDAYRNIENLKAIDEAELNSRSLEVCIKTTQEADLQHIDIFGANVNDGIQQNVQMNVDTRELPENNYGHSSELDFDALHDYLAEVEPSTFVGLLNFGMNISNREKAKAVWCKIRAVVKWRISGRRRIVAA